MFCSDYDVVEDTAELPSQVITDEDISDGNSKVISNSVFRNTFCDLMAVKLRFSCQFFN